MKAFFIFNSSPLTVELCYKHKKACKMQAFLYLISVFVIHFIPY